ncbi:MAG: glycosyltransferase [Chloroflexi bacterium]|nr:glycosyltransferase [Chloroflexota bacterium]
MPAFPPRVFILQNSPLGASQPLSIYLTNFLKYFDPVGEFSLNAITGAAEQGIQERLGTLDTQHHVSGSLYRVRDNLRFTVRCFQILLREHRNRPIALLHCFYPNSSLLAAALFKRLISPEVRILYDVRSPWIEMIFAMRHLDKLWYRPTKAILTIEERSLLRFADHLLFVTRGLAEYYAAHYGYRRDTPVTILGSAVDTDTFQPRPSTLRTDLGLAPEDILIGYTGNLTRARELDRFLRWFGAASGSAPGVNLAFVGDGEQREELERLCEDLRISQRVHFLGDRPHSEVPTLVNGFDYGLCHYPSNIVYDYNHPLKILEYLACGIPVLASDTPSHRELAETVAGIAIYDSAEMLTRLLRQPRPRVDPAGLPFSWSHSIEVYRQLYRDILSGGVGGFNSPGLHPPDRPHA